MNSSAGPDKAQVRAELSAARRARSPEAISAARRAIAAVVLDEQRTHGWGCVAAYVPLRTEPGSLELLGGLVAAGVRVLVPILGEDNDLDWGAWTASGVDEPALGRDAIGAADAVLVPALAVAADGTRLGRGGGSYDRALVRVRRGVPIAALLFDEEVWPNLPADPWDVRVSAVVTPTGWRRLRAPDPDGE